VKSILMKSAMSAAIAASIKTEAVVQFKRLAA